VLQIYSDEPYLLFSDPNRNVIYRLTSDGQSSLFRTKSGYAGIDIGEYKQPGSNGLALDAQGRLTICEHGNRRITRIEHNGVVTVLADRYEGRRLNSPNDLLYRSDGALYFTDPPFGLPRLHDDRRRESPHTGVYCLMGAELKLVSTDLKGPNGLAFSPDEKFLYVTNWDVQKKVVMRYTASSDGSLRDGEVFFDMTDAPGEEALDGMEVDPSGNLFVSGPGGVWIISPRAVHLGTIKTPELPTNFAWGDDGRAMYMTARSGIYRLRFSPDPKPMASSAPFTLSIERADPRFDAILSADAKIETVADGFTWLEGPVWNRNENCLYFSDIPRNTVYRYTRDEGARPFHHPSGYTGSQPFPGREPGSNGLALDDNGRLILCEHGDRRITRINADGSKTVIADRFDGRRLNSPNDCVFRPNGDIYFTDPPFGLPDTFSDPQKELPFSGVFRVTPKGGLDLITRELKAPNGIAFSPAGDVLYLSNADRDNPVWMAYAVSESGKADRGRVFASAAKWVGKFPGNPDGMKTDRQGNLFAAGPGGVYVFSPDGVHLGTMVTTVATSNCAWGDDGSSLYITAGTHLYRVRTLTTGF
jgi:sugar lactone lactonase YvrE